MKAFNRSVFLVAVSMTFLSFCLKYVSEHYSTKYFDGSLLAQIFTEFELPLWLMVILSLVVLVHVSKLVSARLSRIRNYNFMYLALAFLLTSCEELRKGCVTYPSPKDWIEVCEEIPNSSTTVYIVEFLTNISAKLPEIGNKLGNVKVTCKIIRVQRLPHPDVPDSCYWSSDIVETLTGITSAQGFLALNFQYKFDAVGDYFILEGYCEKQGYTRSLFSIDERYYFYNDMWIPCYEGGLPFIRKLEIYDSLTPENSSP